MGIKDVRPHQINLWQFKKKIIYIEDGIALDISCRSDYKCFSVWRIKNHV